MLTTLAQLTLGFAALSGGLDTTLRSARSAVHAPASVAAGVSGKVGSSRTRHGDGFSTADHTAARSGAGKPQAARTIP